MHHICCTVCMEYRLLWLVCIHNPYSLGEEVSSKSFSPGLKGTKALSRGQSLEDIVTGVVNHRQGLETFPKGEQSGFQSQSGGIRLVFSPRWAIVVCLTLEKTSECQCFLPASRPQDDVVLERMTAIELSSVFSSVYLCSCRHWH